MTPLLLLLAAIPGDDCRVMVRHGLDAQACYTRLSTSRDPFVRAEGLWGLGSLDDAMDAFEAALQAQPKSALVRARYGRLYLQRFKQGDAVKMFSEALELDEKCVPALLGLADLMAENFDARAIQLALKAREADPKNVAAIELLARLYLEDSDGKKAAETADEAIKADPDALDAMAVHAAIEILADRPAKAWLQKIAAVNPHYGEAPLAIARLLVLNRRYDEAIDYYKQALALNPNLQAARSELGIQQMRVGDTAEAYRNLEAAYNAHYRNAPTYNSLNLLDSFKHFEFFRTPRVVLMLDKKEADLLRPYVERETLRALDAYEKKYGLKLPGPVQVEMYPNHPDFEIRTMGLPGLGALGVTFDLSVAMDSPSSRTPGSFHWASTLWHELSHVYVLQATHHRVPRWFTEGVAVHEETAVNPEWGDRVTPEILKAIQEHMLLPVNQLDRGFIRPSYPHQVIVSYFQAGRIIDYITDRWGWPKILEMTRAFAADQPTPDVIANVLGISGEQFDKEFDAWLRKEHATPLANFDAWRKAMPELAKAAQAGNVDAVRKLAPELVKEYPDFVEAGCAYEYLAALYEKTGESADLIRVLEQYMHMGGRSPAMLKQLASAHEKEGRTAAAAATLARLNWIAPNDEDLHRRLGGLYAAMKQWNRAVDEFRALVASRPIDAPAAHFQLAQALKESNRLDEAQDEVMAALESAPNYRPAQKLLLELQKTPYKK